MSAQCTVPGSLTAIHARVQKLNQLAGEVISDGELAEDEHSRSSATFMKLSENLKRRQETVPLHLTACLTAAMKVRSTLERPKGRLPKIKERAAALQLRVPNTGELQPRAQALINRLGPELRQMEFTAFSVSVRHKQTQEQLRDFPYCWHSDVNVKERRFIEAYFIARSAIRSASQYEEKAKICVGN